MAMRLGVPRSWYLPIVIGELNTGVVSVDTDRERDAVLVQEGFE